MQTGRPSRRTPPRLSLPRKSRRPPQRPKSPRPSRTRPPLCGSRRAPHRGSRVDHRGSRRDHRGGRVDHRGGRRNRRAHHGSRLVRASCRCAGRSAALGRCACLTPGWRLTRRGGTISGRGRRCRLVVASALWGRPWLVWGRCGQRRKKKDAAVFKRQSGRQVGEMRAALLDRSGS